MNGLWFSILTGFCGTATLDQYIKASKNKNKNLLKLLQVNYNLKEHFNPL
jgi:hypothetical protein